jgi:hypothetical protein
VRRQTGAASAPRAPSSARIRGGGGGGAL